MPTPVHHNDPAVIRRLLGTRGLWAIVGLSDNRRRTAYGIARFVQETLGQRIVAVNPRGESALGAPGLSSLSEIREHVDVVDVFVRSELAGAVVDEAIAIGAGAVWLQVGVVDEAAAARATAAGLGVVMNTCPAIESARR